MLDDTWTFPPFVEWEVQYATSDDGSLFSDWVHAETTPSDANYYHFAAANPSLYYRFMYQVRAKSGVSPYSDITTASRPKIVVLSESGIDYVIGEVDYRPNPPGGGMGGDLTFHYNQGSSATVWTINHNLGKFPSVQVFTSAGDKIEGDVHHINVDSLTITFTAAFAGDAYLN